MKLLEADELEEIRTAVDEMNELVIACRPVWNVLQRKIAAIEELLNVWEFRLKYCDQEEEEDEN